MTPPLQDVQHWFFAPSETSAPLVAAVAAWCLWRRRDRYASLPSAPRPLAGGALLVVCALCYAWSRSVGADALLPLSLTLVLLAVAVWEKGLQGARCLALPLIVLALALPVPYPLYHDVVWTLQRISADGALRLMQGVGLDAVGHGLVILHRDQRFLVIEACSGLRGVRTLLVIAVVLGELFRAPRGTRLLLVAVAPLIAMATNVARVAWIAANPSPEIQSTGGHVGQGIATLILGSVLLFAIAQVLCRGSGSAGEPTAATPAPPPKRTGARWPLRTACLAILVALWLVIPTRELPSEGFSARPALPSEQRGWQGQDERVDWLFLGELPIGAPLSRKYAFATRADRQPSPVHVFAARSRPGVPPARFDSPKLRLPGAAWTVVRELEPPPWATGIPMETLLVETDRTRALVYYWSPEPSHLVRDSLRNWLALDRDAAARGRSVIRLWTRLGDLPRAEQRARVRLNRFRRDFLQQLADI